MIFIIDKNDLSDNYYQAGESLNMEKIRTLFKPGLFFRRLT